MIVSINRHPPLRSANSSIVIIVMLYKYAKYDNYIILNIVSIVHSKTPPYQKWFPHIVIIVSVVSIVMLHNYSNYDNYSIVSVVRIVMLHNYANYIIVIIVSIVRDLPPRFANYNIVIIVSIVSIVRHPPIKLCCITMLTIA